MKLRLLYVLLLSLPATLALAGGSDLDGGDDDAELGAYYFGEVKDVKGLQPLEGVRITALKKGTKMPVMASTDGDGRFKIPGFGKEVNSDDITVACAKTGWKLLDLSRRKMAKDADSPVEIECLMEKL